jgi:hypothetical protein
MQINVEKTNVIVISTQPFPIQITIDQKAQENVEFFNYLYGMMTK